MDQKDGSIWVTGNGYRDLSRIGDEWPETIEELYEITGVENCTQKFDSEGRRLLRLYEGGNSLIIDPFDNSVWITGEKSIAHFSRTGEKLRVRTRIPDGSKWIALIPGA